MLLDMHVSAIICAYGCYTRLLWIIPVCVSLRYRVIHSFSQDVDKHYACNLLITCLYTGYQQRLLKTMHCVLVCYISYPQLYCDCG